MIFFIWFGLASLFLVQASERDDKCERCDPNATCEDEECVCLEGFIGNGTKCTRSIPECGVCSVNGHCVNGECRCNADYIGNGTVCIKAGPCKRKCPPKSKCLNGTCVKDASNCTNCGAHSRCTDAQCKCICGFKQEGDKCVDDGTKCKRCPQLSSCEHVDKDCHCSPGFLMEGKCCLRKQDIAEAVQHGDVTTALIDMFTNSYRPHDATNKTATEQPPPTGSLVTNDTQNVQDNNAQKPTPSLSLANKNNTSDVLNNNTVNDESTNVTHDTPNMDDSKKDTASVDDSKKDTASGENGGKDTASGDNGGKDTASGDNGRLTNRTTEESALKSSNVTLGGKNITNEIHNASVSSSEDDSLLKAAAKQTPVTSEETATAVAVAPAPISTSGKATEVVGTKDAVDGKELLDGKVAFKGKDSLEVKVTVEGKTAASPTITPITTGAPKTVPMTTQISTRKPKSTTVVSGPSYPTPKRPPFPPMSYNLPSTIIHYGPSLSPTLNPGQDPSLPNLKVGPVEVIDENTAHLENPAIPNIVPIGPIAAKTHVIDFNVDGIDSHVQDIEGASTPSGPVTMETISQQYPGRKIASRKHHIKKVEALKHASLFSNPHPDNPSAMLLPSNPHKKLSRRTHIRTRVGERRSAQKQKAQKHVNAHA